MIINHNITSLNTLNKLATNNNSVSKSLEKLSSGLRINRAGDDAAGLAISEKMRGQIRGLDQASSNSQDGISLIQTAEGALNETHSILQRMRELAVQSSTDTNTSSDRQEIQKEVDQLSSEVTRIANTTEFNTQKLLNGGIKQGAVGELTFQIGANASQNLSLNISAMDAKSLGVAADLTTATVASGATDVTGAELSRTVGTSIASGNTVLVTATTVAAAGAWSAAATGVTGTTLATTTNSSKYNDWKITTSTGGSATIGASIDSTNKVITLSGDSVVGSWTATAINTALTNAGISDISATGNASAVTATANAAQTTAGLGSNEVKLHLAQGANSFDAIIANNSASYTVATDAKFKGLTLTFDGSLTTATAATITIGNTAATAATFANGAKTADAVASAGIDVSTQSAANTAITTIQTAIERVSAERSKLGAMQNRLEHTINNLTTSSENITAAESRIRDVNMAKEMTNFQKNNILSQAATAMLAQANQQPQGVLQLLK